MSEERRGCFLVGSGPSLNEVDVKRLAHLDTIAFNGSYVAWERWGFAPTHYACVDPIVFEDNAPEIRNLIGECPATRFFLPRTAGSFGIDVSERVAFVGLVPGSGFTADIRYLTDFGNVGATSFQILALLGYRRIVMVGVDGRYAPIAESVLNTEVDGFVRLEDDPNHFCPEYARGKRLHARPDMEKILGSWPEVAKECAIASIEVRNASPGSALHSFPPMDFETAIDWVRSPSCVQAGRVEKAHG